MSGAGIPAEAVEAAAWGVWAYFGRIAASNTSEPTADDYATARVALEAAALHLRAAALTEAADMVRDKDHRKSLHADQYDIGWGRSLDEAEHEIRQIAEAVRRHE